MNLMICLDCAKALAEVHSKGGGGPCCVCGQRKPEGVMGPITERERDRLRAAYATVWQDGWSSGVDDEQQSATYSKRRADNPYLRPTDEDKAARVIPGGVTFTGQLSGYIEQGGDLAYLLLTLQHVEAQLERHPDHPTLRGQRQALLGAVRRATPPAANQPSAVILKAGPEAVALRERFSDVDRAEQALGDYLLDRPEIANDDQLSVLAELAQNAVRNLSVAITTKLRKLCGVSP